MISAVIATMNDAPRLTATLASLASAAVDGLVREVIVVDAGSKDATLEVAEESGATVLAGLAGLAGACNAARQPWLLILAVGTRPQIGWEGAVHAHLRDYPGTAGWFDLALAAPGPAARLTEALARVEGGLLARPRPAHGLLISKRLFNEVGGPRAHEDIIRGLGRGRLRSLGVRILQAAD
jgi:glycosyltransferase involved in cell wall biosynthesis